MDKLRLRGTLATARKHLPGFIINESEPGLDGAFYTIEDGSDPLHRNLYKCREVETNGGDFVEVEKIGENLPIEKLYDEITWAGIYLRGYETIILGLPYHRDPYGEY